jgi:hypothetical protein
MFDTDPGPDPADPDPDPADFDPDAFLAWLNDLDELTPPPAPETPDYTSLTDLDPTELTEPGLLDYLTHLHRQIAGLHA